MSTNAFTRLPQACPASRIIESISGTILHPLPPWVASDPGAWANEAWLAWHDYAVDGDLVGRRKPSAIPATALLPIVLIPAMGHGVHVASATTPYANPISFFLFMEWALYWAWRCNAGICTSVLRDDDWPSVASHAGKIAGFMIATAFPQMWS